MFLNGRQYSVTFEAVAITALQDLFAIVAAAGKNVYLNGLELFQTTDLGDAAEEILRLRCRSGQTTVGSGGGAGTNVPVNVTDAAAGFTSRINDTTQAVSGTIVSHWVDGWNIRMPYKWEPPANKWIPLTGGRRATIELVAAPVDSITVSGTLWVFEVG